MLLYVDGSNLISSDTE